MSEKLNNELKLLLENFTASISSTNIYENNTDDINPQVKETRLFNDSLLMKRSSANIVSAVERMLVELTKLKQNIILNDLQSINNKFISNERELTKKCNETRIELEQFYEEISILSSELQAQTIIN